jgi:hypothetical protein
MGVIGALSSGIMILPEERRILSEGQELRQ